MPTANRLSSTGLDFIGNKIQWPYAYLYNTPERSTEVLGAHGTRHPGVPVVVACLLPGLSTTLSCEPNRRRSESPTYYGRGSQGTLASTAGEALVHLGRSEDLSFAGCHGRTLRPQSTASESLDPSVTACPAGNP